MFVALLAVIVITCILISKNVYNRYKLQLKTKGIPSPPTLPWLGNLHHVFGDREHVWNKGRYLIKKYYPIFAFWTPSWAFINLVHPDDVESVLTNIKHSRKSDIYDLIRPWMGQGLLTSDGKLWQHRRKTLTPAFHFSILHKYMQSILEHSENMIKSLRSKEGEIIIDLEPWVTDFTLSVICEAAMGVSLHDIDKVKAKEYKKAVNLIGDIASYRLIRPWFIPDWIFSLTPMGRTQAATLKTLHNFSTKIINDRKNYHEKTNGKYLTQYYNTQNMDDINSPIMESTTKKLAMLDLLIAASQNDQIDFHGIREEVDTFIFEGYDTTAMALTYSLLMLAEHSEIQQRAREEVDQVWEECKGNIKMAEIQRFSYLERCIKEALRLYPSVPFISRKLTDELHLRDHVIPPGMSINIHIYDIHRDPNYWPDPEVYNPDRFLPERSQARHPYSYIPFSGGFRNCIGQKFAMLEMKSFIGFLLHNFKIEAVDKEKDLKFIIDLVLRSKHPIRIKLIPINHD